MYTDPSLIREHVVKLRLNDQEWNLIDAWVNYTGQQRAVLLREMLLEQARMNLMADAQQSEGPQMALSGF
jgi:hypothetical protein